MLFPAIMRTLSASFLCDTVTRTRTSYIIIIIIIIIVLVFQWQLALQLRRHELARIMIIPYLLIYGYILLNE